MRTSSWFTNFGIKYRITTRMLADYSSSDFCDTRKQMFHSGEILNLLLYVFSVCFHHFGVLPFNIKITKKVPSRPNLSKHEVPAGLRNSDHQGLDLLHTLFKYSTYK